MEAAILPISQWDYGKDYSSYRCCSIRTIVKLFCIEDRFMTKVWDICNNLNQFVALRPAYGLNYDVIKMATNALIIYDAF